MTGPAGESALALGPGVTTPAAGRPPPLLTVEHLSMRFGGLMAVDDLSFTARYGEITAIIGPNGAGKTTLFNCLTGFYRPSVGRLELQRRDGERFLLERMEGFRIARAAGIARTFQNIRLFPRMTVLENLVVAQHNKLMRASLWSVAGMLGLKGFRAAEAAAVDKARQWLDRLGLLDRADREAGTLPYGAQRRLEIARAMCTDPVLLCLDEPAAGLNPRESAELNRLLLDIRDRYPVGLLLIEHDMSVVMGISDHVVVLDYGRKIAEGRPADISRNPEVIRAYLGEVAGEAPPPPRQPRPRTAEPMLAMQGLYSGYGPITVLRDIAIEVHRGEIVTLIGANGAGKSTLLMTLCGDPRAQQGHIRFEGRDITRLPTFDIMRLGIAHAPEGRRVFPRMSVLDNLQMGASAADPKHFAADLARVFELFPLLQQRRGQRGGTLSGGEQQMLAIGRALMSRPKLLLLDEPSLGLAPLVVKHIFAALKQINEDLGTTILLVEQNAHHALRLADRGYVLANGSITLSGSGGELLADPNVQAAYLEGGVAP